MSKQFFKFLPPLLQWGMIFLLFLNFYPSAEAEEGSLWPDKLKVGGEFRLRVESQLNYDFDTPTPDNDTFVLLRTRAYLDFRPSKGAQLFVMFQDSESLDQSTALIKSPDRHQIYQGFLSFQTKGKLDTRIKVGRQELKYGDERLIGSSDWSNLGRSFDGAVLRLEDSNFWFDLFGARIDPPGPTGEMQFGGAYGHWKRFPQGELEPYALFLHGANAGLNQGDLSLLTLGTRIRGKFKKNFDYGFEGAYQTGKSSGNLVSAFATHLELGYTFPVSWKPMLRLEYNFASGDDHPTSGTVTTFNNLFPTNHKFYGYMDLFSWKNLHNVRTTFAAAPTKFMETSLDYHLFWLPDPANGAFLDNGAQLRPGIPGASSFAGQEIDLLIKFKPIRYFDAWIGYSVFFPGAFFSDTGGADIAHYFYTQLTARY